MPGPAWRLLLLLLALAGAVRAQEAQNLLHYPLQEELGALLAAAERAREAGRWDEAARLYRSVLDGDRPASGEIGYQLVPWPGSPLPGAPRRFKGLTQAALEGLRALPPAGLRAWRRQFDHQAAAVRERALAGPDPLRALARAYELHPVSSCAAAMLEAMGDLAFEQGDLERARRAFEELLLHHPDQAGPEAEEEPGRVSLKLLACTAGLELQRQRGRPRPGQAHLVQARGDAQNRAATEGRVGVGRPRFEPRWFDRLEGGPLLRTRIPGAPARYLPLASDGTAFLITADQLLGFDLRSGASRPPIPRLDPTGSPYREGNTKVQLGGALERGVLVAPQLERVRRDQRFRGIQVTAAIPVRKLAGFDPATWRWRWSHARSLPGSRQADWSWPSPPVCAEGVGYAAAWAIQGFVNSYATAFDVHTGRLLWETWVVSGQMEQTMFGEQAGEPLCVSPAFSAGVVYHLTSFGCLAALAAETGRPLWVTEYEQLEVRPPRGFYADTRPIQWENNPPLVEDGVVVVAPLDSPACYGFEAATGRMLWRNPRAQPLSGLDLRYVIGAAAGRVVLAGARDVACLSVRSGKLLWRSSVGTEEVSGRGVIARDRVCVPLDGQVVVLDLESGRVIDRAPLSLSGNLALCGPHALVTSSDGALVVHENRE